MKKISFLEISRAYRSKLEDRSHSKQEDCPGIERIMAVVLSDVPGEEKELISSHAANCPKCSELLKKAQGIAQGLDDYVDRYKALIKLSTKEASAPKNRLLSWITGYRPIVISAALIFVFLCGIFILVPKTRLNTRDTSSGEQIILIKPVNIRVKVDDLQFAWKEVPKSRNCFIELFDKTLSLVWRSEPSSESKIEVPANVKGDLRPGAYYWIVTAIMKDDTSLKSDLKEFTIYQ